MDLDFRAKVIAHSLIIGSESPSYDTQFVDQATRMLESVKNHLMEMDKDNFTSNFEKYQKLVDKYIVFWKSLKKGEVNAFGNKCSDSGKGSKSKTTVRKRNKVRVDSSKRKSKKKKSLRRR